jgi:hypothetical protein
VATRKLATGDHDSEEMPSLGGFATWKSLFGLGTCAGCVGDGAP